MFARLVSRRAPNLPALLYPRAQQAQQSQTQQSTAANIPAQDFSRPVRPEFPSPVRHGFIPEEWFTFFYPKTGVTGPYIFATTFGCWLLSKEIYVLEHEFYAGLSLGMITLVAVKKLGPHVAAYLDKEIDNYEAQLESSRTAQVQGHENLIKHYKSEEWRTEAIPMIMEAKKNNITLQLEAAYRERVQLAYQEVKKRLDYQLQLQTAERQFSQKHMVQWIVDNVKKAFTPEQEKIVLQKCISDLQGLVKA